MLRRTSGAVSLVASRWLTVGAAALMCAALAGPARGAPEATAPAADTAKRAVLLANLRIAASELTLEELRHAYLGKRTFWSSGARVVPILRREDHTSMNLLLNGILRMTWQELRSNWSAAELSGRGMTPTTLHDTATLVKALVRVPGAIAVITEDEFKTISAEDAAKFQHVIVTY